VVDSEQASWLTALNTSRARAESGRRLRGSRGSSKIVHLYGKTQSATNQLPKLHMECHSIPRTEGAVSRSMIAEFCSVRAIARELFCHTSGEIRRFCDVSRSPISSGATRDKLQRSVHRLHDSICVNAADEKWLACSGIPTWCQAALRRSNRKFHWISLGFQLTLPWNFTSWNYIACCQHRMMKTNSNALERNLRGWDSEAPSITS